MSILWNPTEVTVIEKVSLPVITTGTQNMGDGIYWLKAGTPLDEDLAVANDGDAMYIVAEDFFFISTNPNQDRHVPLVKAGYVDLNKAEAAAGITYADAAVAALKEAGIEVVDGLLETGGGGSGGDVLMVNVEYKNFAYTADASYEDVRAAVEAGAQVFMTYSNSLYRFDTLKVNSVSFSRVSVSPLIPAVTQDRFNYSSSGLSRVEDTVHTVWDTFPYAPEEDGVYTLTCTVEDDGSTVNYSWVSSGT